MSLIPDFKLLFEDIWIDNDNKLHFDYNKSKKDRQSTQLGKGNFVPRITKQKHLSSVPIYSVYQLSKISGTVILKALKKRNNLKLSNKDYQQFLNRSAIYISAKLLKGVDVIVTPETSSFLLQDLLDKIALIKPEIKIIMNGFKKLPVDKIKIDYTKYNVNKSTIKRLEKIIADAKESGFIEIKKVPKRFLELISNVLGLDSQKINTKYIDNKSVVIFDDLIGSGFTMKEMILNLKTFNPGELKGITMFKS